MENKNPPCPRCRSTETAVVPGPHPGGHFARLECANCFRFLRWLPAPRGGPMPESLKRLLRSEGPPADLRGTEGQIGWAWVIRRAMAIHFRKVGREDLVDLTRVVVDASWFIANRDCPVDALKWPREHQLESIGSTLPIPGE